MPLLSWEKKNNNFGGFQLIFDFPLITITCRLIQNQHLLIIKSNKSNMTSPQDQYSPINALSAARTNVIQDILDQDVSYYDSVSKSLSADILIEITHLLLAERDQLKFCRSELGDRLMDAESELESERNKVAELKAHVQILEQQCEGFRNLIQQNQRRFTQQNQSSCSMIKQITGELQKEIYENMELKNLIKQLKHKSNQIKRLEANLAKINEENESLKKLRGWNVMLSEQLLSTQQKLAEKKQVQRQQKQQIKQLQDKLSILQQKNEELQYITNNQIEKIKEMINDGARSNSVPKIKQVRNQQNAQLLKEIEENFQPEFFNQFKQNKQIKKNKQEIKKGENDFQSSLDNFSEHWDKISLKQIEASSKNKPFSHNIFSDSQPQPLLNQFQSQKNRKLEKQPQQKIKKFQPIKPFLQKQLQIEDNMKQDIQIPLSIKKPTDKKSVENQSNSLFTSMKRKFNFNIKIPQKQSIQQTPVSSRSQTNDANVVQLGKNNYHSPRYQLQTKHRQLPNTQIKMLKGTSIQQIQLKNKQKQIESLSKKLIQLDQTIRKLQRQLKTEQANRQNQVNLLEQQLYSQIAAIERLTGQLEYQKLKNIQQLRKKQQNYSEKLLQSQKLIKQYDLIIRRQQQQMVYQKKQLDELLQHFKQVQNSTVKISKMVQVQQKKWQLKQSRKLTSTDQSSQTQRQPQIINKSDIILTSHLTVSQQFNFWPVKDNKTMSTNTETKQTKNAQILTMTCFKFDIETNTELSYCYNQQNRKQNSTMTESQKNINGGKIINTYTQTQAQTQAQIQQRSIGIDVCAVNKNTQCQTDVQHRYAIMEQCSKIVDIKIPMRTNKQNTYAQTLNKYHNKYITDVISIKFDIGNKSQLILPLLLEESQKRVPVPLKQQDQKKSHRKQIKLNWPIKKFIPVSEQQQLRQMQRQQKILFDLLQQQKILSNQSHNADGTVYYSIIAQQANFGEENEYQLPKELQDRLQIEHKKQILGRYDRIYEQQQRQEAKQQIEKRKTVIKLQTVAISTLGKITKLTPSKVSSLIPSLKEYQCSPKICLSDIITRNRNRNIKQYYVIRALLHKTEAKGTHKQLITDKLLLWKEGIVSLEYGQSLIMAGIKKYIYDPVNWILGNCEIIIDRQLDMIDIKRSAGTGKKNYFMGDLGDYSWRVLSVEGFGAY